MKFLKLIKTFMLLSHIFQLKQRTISILKLFDVKANRSSRSGCHGNWIAVSLLTHQDRDSTSLSTIWSKRSRSKFFFWAYKTSQVSESNVHKFTSTCIDSCQTFDLESFKSNPFYYDKSIPSCFPEWLGFPQSRCFLNAVVCPISVSMVETHIDRTLPINKTRPCRLAT